MHTKRALHIVIVLGIVLASACSAAQQPTPTSTPDPLALQIDQFMTSVEEGKFSGSILVAKDGIVIISKGYGMANYELDVPNTPKTKFRLGSVSKQFTAMAILLLQQQGKLNITDSICDYISCPETWQPITIRHLLTHTSGIPNFTDASFYADIKQKPTLPMVIINRLRDLPPDFAPGESWSYSNSGYIALGVIIERVARQPYDLYLKNNIFEPLQMTDTGYDSNRLVIKNRASGYSMPSMNAEYIDMSVPHAAGGLYSTVEDLYLWDQALYTDKLVPQSLIEEMLTPYDSAETGYGYGWFIDEQHGHKVVGHGGGIDGFATQIDRYPEEKVVIIILSNRQDSDPGKIAREIAGLIFPATPTQIDN